MHIFNADHKVSSGRFAGDGRDEAHLMHLFDSLTWWGRALATARAADSRK